MDFVDLVRIDGLPDYIFKAPAFSGLKAGDTVSTENSDMNLEVVKDVVTVSATDDSVRFILNLFDMESLDELESITGKMGYFPGVKE